MHTARSRPVFQAFGRQIYTKELNLVPSIAKIIRLMSLQK